MGDRLGDLLGDFFLERDLGDNDLRFCEIRVTAWGDIDRLSFFNTVAAGTGL